MLTGAVKIAKLAFVPGKVVLHESAIGETDIHFQQNVSGFSGSLHLVKCVAVMKPAPFVIRIKLRKGMGHFSGEGPVFGCAIDSPAEVEHARSSAQGSSDLIKLLAG